MGVRRKKYYEPVNWIELHRYMVTQIPCVTTVIKVSISQEEVISLPAVADTSIYLILRFSICNNHDRRVSKSSQPTLKHMMVILKEVQMLLIFKYDDVCCEEVAYGMKIPYLIHHWILKFFFFNLNYSPFWGAPLPVPCKRPFSPQNRS